MQKDRKKLDRVEYALGSKAKLPPPAPGPGVHFDGCVAIMSRVFDPDRDRVIGRSRPEGIAGMLCWSPEIEKLEELHKLCKGNDSLCYFMAGIHPDNISRTNKSQQDAWHLKVDEFSRERSCLAIYSGLNLTRRDTGSHFAQEAMLRCLYHQAESISVPLVLFIEPRAAEVTMTTTEADGSAVNTNAARAAEVLREEGWSAGGVPVIVMDAVGVARGSAQIMDALVAEGFLMSVSLNDILIGADGEEGLAECLLHIPPERLLLSSNSPHHTPQNIPDESIRLSKNEPSNFDYIVHYLSPLLGLSVEELAGLNCFNSKRVFKIDITESFKAVADNVEDNLASQLRNTTEPPLEDVAALALIDSSSSEISAHVCAKCCKVLFSPSQLVYRHAVPGSEDFLSVFRADSTDSFCSAVYFLPLSALSAGAITMDDKGNVGCANCAAKIGKQQEAEVSGKAASCPCGHVLQAASGFIRLTSSKAPFRNKPTSSIRCTAEESLDNKQTGQKNKAGVVNVEAAEMSVDSKGGKKEKGGKKKRAI